MNDELQQGLCKHYRRHCVAKKNNEAFIAGWRFVNVSDSVRFCKLQISYHLDNGEVLLPPQKLLDLRPTRGKTVIQVHQHVDGGIHVCPKECYRSNKDNNISKEDGVKTTFNEIKLLLNYAL